MLQVPRVAVALAASLVAAVITPGSLRAQDVPVTFQSFAVNLAGSGPKSGQLTITIERWSSDEERDKVRDALTEKGGGDALLSTIQKIKPRAGFIRTSTSLGWDIQYARRTELPGGGYRVIFATDRPIGFRETVNNPRSSDYQFMLAELHMGADGKGEGKLVPRAKVQFDQDSKTIQIENYTQQPVQLTQVVESKPKK